MRVLVEHHGARRLLRPAFVLELHFQFTNEERAVIRTRGLQKYTLDISPGYLVSSETVHTVGSVTITRSAATYFYVAGAVLLFLAALSGIGTFLGVLLLFGGPALFWYAMYAGWRFNHANLSEITIGYMVAHPHIAIRAENPGQARLLEETIMRRVADLKEFISQSTEIASPTSYEF